MTISNLKGFFYFFINGKEFVEQEPDPEWTLLYYLRRRSKLPGTKLGCGEGGCGACTVMVSSLERNGQLRHFSVNACLTPVVALHGMAVTSVEGVGSLKTTLHPIQEKLTLAHGSQCGFCTPGFIMSMYALLRVNSSPTMDEIEENLFGNLCRCTGYRPILEGFREFTGCGAKDCCQISGNSGKQCDKDTPPPTTISEWDNKNQDVIFPPQLRAKTSWDEECLVFIGPRITWLQPQKLSDLLALKAKHPEAKIVAGNTIIGIEAKYLPNPHKIQIHAAKVQEMNVIQRENDGLRIGASLCLSDVESELKNIIKEKPEKETRVLAALLDMVRWFANKQIKNVASLGGNIVTGSSVSSFNHILLASGAKLHIQSTGGKREIIMDEKFFDRDTKKIPIEPTEVLVSITVPYSKKNEYFDIFRQAKRRVNDSSIVISAMKVVFNDSFNVDHFDVAVGGMAKTPIMASKMNQILKGRNWDSSLLEDASNLLMEEFHLDSSAPGGSVHFRKTLLLSFFMKFYLRALNHLNQISNGKIGKEITAEEQSILTTPNPIEMKSTQFYDKDASESNNGPVGKPLLHNSGYKHTTGEAVYVDDMPTLENELYGFPVLSFKAKARIENIDASAALRVKGVEQFISAKDMDATLNITGFGMDEEIFPTKEVCYAGQIIGMVVATTKEIAKKASKLVKVTYKDSPEPPLLGIEDAIKRKQFYVNFEVRKGDVTKGFEDADEILEGKVHISAQEHFYMEPHICIAIPQEDSGMILYSSTQDPAMVQMTASAALGVPASRVVAKVKRIGGGFGGKVCAAARLGAITAVTAQKAGKPVRVSLDRDIDMMFSGKGHSDTGKWKVGFTKDGRITAIHADIYANGGCYRDLSEKVASKSLLHFDNVYNVDNITASMTSCKTNMAPSTALRGLGTPHTIFVMENILNQVASRLNMSQRKIREMHIYSDGNPITYYGQTLEGCSIRRCWDEALKQSNYDDRRKQVDKFNRENKYHKRGLSVMPCKQGVCFAIKCLSQSGALVHVYLDGSVLLTHGGAEMGQGVQTKMIQIAATELGVPADQIYTAEHATDKVPNTSPTAASTGTDLNGFAVQNACQKIHKRLEPFKKANPDAEWNTWVQGAYMEQVSLSATGFYRDPHVLDYNFTTQSGHPFTYFTYGAGACEVEVDVLTGDHHVRRVDLVVDAGDSINPRIDIGQVEGAFVQGCGNLTTEELLCSPQGNLRTQGPYTYKIPSVNDIPREFNVSLLRNSANPRAIYSSRGVGEGPLILANAAFFAIKDAIAAAKSGGPFRLDAPATVERIRMACDDDVIVKTASGSDNMKPWSITF